MSIYKITKIFLKPISFFLLKNQANFGSPTWKLLNLPDTNIHFVCHFFLLLRSMYFLVLRKLCNRQLLARKRAFLHLILFPEHGINVLYESNKQKIFRFSHIQIIFQLLIRFSKQIHLLVILN